MAIFEEKLIINPNESKEGKLNNNQESVFNKFLENVTDIKIDPRFGDKEHSLLETKDGKTYCFDSYKYIYPVKYVSNDPDKKYIYPINYDGSDCQVINNDIGHGMITRTSLFEENKILIEYFINNNIMKRLVYRIPDKLTDLMKSNDSFGINYYLLNVSTLQQSALQGLRKESELSVVRDSIYIKCRNENDEIIQKQPSTGTFFEDSMDVIEKVINSNERQIKR